MNTQEKAKFLDELTRRGLAVVEIKENGNIKVYGKADILKPELNTIDMSVLVGSNVDCEFGDKKRIGKLEVIYEGKGFIYQCSSINGRHATCRPRMTPHVHAWMGGECPLPEGFRIKVYARNGAIKEYTTGENPGDFHWKHADDLGTRWARWDIIAFEVIGVADGWKLPFEE